MHVTIICIRFLQSMRPSPCQLPFVMYAKAVEEQADGKIISTYERTFLLHEVDACSSLPSRIYTINVIMQKKRAPIRVKENLSPGSNLRRGCCEKMDVFETHGGGIVVDLYLHECHGFQSPGDDRLLIV